MHAAYHLVHFESFKWTPFVLKCGVLPVCLLEGDLVKFVYVIVKLTLNHMDHTWFERLPSICKAIKIHICANLSACNFKKLQNQHYGIWGCDK